MEIGLGAGLFATAYFSSVLAALMCSDFAGSCGNSTHEAFLYVPGVGPVFQMFQTSTKSGFALLAADTAMQLGGIALIVHGAVWAKPELEQDEKPGGPRLTITTLVGPRGPVFVGTF